MFRALRSSRTVLSSRISSSVRGAILLRRSAGRAFNLSVKLPRNQTFKQEQISRIDKRSDINKAYFSNDSHHWPVATKEGRSAALAPPGRVSTASRVAD